MESDVGTEGLGEGPRAHHSAAQGSHFFQIRMKAPQLIKGQSSCAPIEWNKDELVASRMTVLYADGALPIHIKILREGSQCKIDFPCHWLPPVAAACCLWFAEDGGGVTAP